MVRRIARAGAVVAVLALTLAGCADAGRTSSLSSSASASTASPSPAPARLDLRPLAAAADRANAHGDRTVIAAAARPTVVSRHGALQTMVVQDQDLVEWRPGSYRLVVRCAGEGTVFAHLSIGSIGAVKGLPPCTPDVSTGVVNLDLSSAQKDLKVVLVPVGRTRAAVAYQVQRQG